MAGQAVILRSMEKPAPRVTQAGWVKGRQKARALATEPAWSSARAFIAHDEGRNPSQ